MRRFWLILLIFSVLPGASVALETRTLLLRTADADHRLQIELAETRADRQLGLMHRRSLAPYDGMLFDFKEMRRIGMWMKNTWIPLDMVFFDDTRRVVHIQEHTVPFSEAIIESPLPARYVLELEAGAARRYGLTQGDRFELEEAP